MQDGPGSTVTHTMLTMTFTLLLYCTGECDLVLLSAPEFEQDTSLEVHIRTQHRYEYSFISSAAIRVGEDTFEVQSFGQYSMNGVDSAVGEMGENNIPLLGGFPVYHRQASKKRQEFDIVLGVSENITISTFKDMVSVAIHGSTEEHFGQVSGILGSFEGIRYGRDGTSTFQDDMNAYGQEWQVRDTEDGLFQVARAPQYPQKCRLPGSTTSQKSRRLGEKTVRMEEAQVACSKYEGYRKTACVHDVLSTGDLDIASESDF